MKPTEYKITTLKIFLWQVKRHADILATILAMKSSVSVSVSMSVSASWNASYIATTKLHQLCAPSTRIVPLAWSRPSLRVEWVCEWVSGGTRVRRRRGRPAGRLTNGISMTVFMSTAPLHNQLIVLIGLRVLQPAMPTWMHLEPQNSHAPTMYDVPTNYRPEGNVCK